MLLKDNSSFRLSLSWQFKFGTQPILLDNILYNFYKYVSQNAAPCFLFVLCFWSLCFRNVSVSGLILCFGLNVCQSIWIYFHVLPSSPFTFKSHTNVHVTFSFLRNSVYLLITLPTKWVGYFCNTSS